MALTDQKSIIIKLAHIYYHTGNWDKAVMEYEKIIGLDPNDFNVHITLGELFLKKGDLTAMREFEISANGFLREKNMRKAAGAVREMVDLIQKMVEPQDLDHAEAMYKEILGKMPDSTETLSNLRDLYQRNNRMEEALSCTMKLGDLYNRQDYIDKAESEYLKATVMDPRNTDVQSKLDLLRAESGHAKPAGEAGYR